MSALTPLPSPRPHAVSAASAQEAEREEEFLVASRPHLRLVTDDFVPETSRADPVVELPAELTRRPVTPRAARSALGGGGVAQARPADLAPHHPAVRASVAVSSRPSGVGLCLRMVQMAQMARTVRRRPCGYRTPPSGCRSDCVALW